ncbi:chemotaxis protein CheB [Oligoflexus tunisiensis]|uniref:chemotaxis protein CheB n=1 Tax=Oligoflexus tunisiensis TaxID=708132 RepID=UPI00114CDDD0|nr:chemotaxis protein CheB [Oligoflexus tunisiensis]
MTLPKLIVIGGSAGAIPTVLEIARGLPPNFSVPICVVIHFHPNARSVLPMLLESTSGIPAKHPQTQEFLMPRHIYVAPPDRHMVIHKNRILLHRGPHENRCRPAIDPLFRTAAAAFGPSVVAVLLSGYLDDGTAGLLAIKKEGGTVIIQDPADTPFNDMPRHALSHVYPDYLLPHKDIAGTLHNLTLGPVAPRRQLNVLPNDPISEDLVTGSPPPVEDPDAPPQDKNICALCQKSQIVTLRGRAGGAQDTLDSALWSALRALDEKISLHRQLMQRAEELHQTLAVRKYNKIIETTELHMQLIRQILEQYPMVPRPMDELSEKPVPDRPFRT